VTAPGKSHSEVSNGGSEAGQTDILPSWPYLKPTPISVTTGFAARNAVLLDRSVMVIPRSPSNSIEPALYNGRWPCAAAIAARTGHVGSMRSALRICATNGHFPASPPILES
jgi:hypothetical protein